MKSGLATQSVRSFLSGFDRVDVEAWSSHRNEVGTQGEGQLGENVYGGYGEGGRRSSGDADLQEPHRHHLFFHKGSAEGSPARLLPWIQPTFRCSPWTECTASLDCFGLAGLSQFLMVSPRPCPFLSMSSVGAERSEQIWNQGWCLSGDLGEGEITAIEVCV